MTREVVYQLSWWLCVGFCALAGVSLLHGDRWAAVLCALLTTFWLAVYMLASSR